MPSGNFPLYSLNGGEVGRDALARFDLERMQYAADICENAFPEVIGRLRNRPGFEFLETYEEGSRLIDFVVDGNNTSLLVLSPSGMRILRNGTYLSRADVDTEITNGEFQSGLTGWSDESTGGASISVSAGDLLLTGDSGSVAIARQNITVSAADENTEHALNINVLNGPIQVRIGSNSGQSNILGPFTLEDGRHSLAFTPGENSIWLDLYTDLDRVGRIERCIIDPPGDVIVIHPWDAEALRTLQYTQSLDVLFVASDGFQQRRIERRGDSSWSIVRYKTEDGPFDVGQDTTATIAPSTTSGTGTFTASEDLFSALDVGSLVRLTHSQQLAESTFTAGGQFTSAIRIVGVGSGARSFTVSIDVDGSWSGTITLEQSIGVEGDWTSFQTYTTDTTENVNDDLDNQIVFYRLNVTAYTAGTADVSLRYEGGTTQGIGRITDFNSATSVDMEVLAPFGSTNPTSNFDLGAWSDANGWPRSVAFHDGRLWWGRGDVVYGSVSDQFSSYSDTVVGDSGPVIRSVGPGPQRGIVWLQSLQRLIAGTDISEVSIRASSFDEPLTATAFVPRDASTRGCADIAAVKIDTSAIFVQRSGFRVFDLVFAGETSDYVSRDVTELHTDVCRVDGSTQSVVAMAVQRQPDTRIWFVLSDGSVRVLTYEPSENVVAWSRLDVGGFVEDVQVLPSTLEDQVYIAVRRTINGNTVRYLERMARVDQANGGNITQISDSFAQVTNSPASATVTGLSHLEGEEVVVWADGAAAADQSSMLTVTGGQITLPAAATNITVGLPYTARWRSTKLAYGAARGTALSQYKRPNHLGLYFVDTALAGVRIGRDFDNLTGVATNDRGRPIAFNSVLETHDVDLQQINGDWDVDSRVCIEMRAPYPVSPAALVIAMKTNDR